MPKKFSTGNTKAVAARERKAQVKEADKLKKQQEEEDAYWEDDDKSVKKKQQRKEEREKKKQEVLDKKAESKALLEKELGSIVTAKKQAQAKITRAQIQEETERRQAAATGGKVKPQIETHLTKPLEENVNRLRVEGDEARSVDEAIRVLSLKDDEPVDLHPERRVKAAFNAFKEKRLPILKMENPSLRLSQLNQMIFKEWQSSPENPING